jgi:hypothetical protein
VAAGQRRVLERLVGGEVCDQARVAAGRTVAVDHERAPRCAGKRDHLASAAVSVGVAAERWTIAPAALTSAARAPMLRRGGALAPGVLAACGEGGSGCERHGCLLLVG